MNKIFQIVLIIFLGIFQVIFMPFLSIQGVWPNLVLIFAVLLVLNSFDREAILVSGVAGVVLDMASPFFFGFFTILLLGFTLILQALNHRYLNEPNFYLSLLIVGICAALWETIFFFLAPNYSWHTILISIIYAIFLAVPIYNLLSFWHKRINEIELAS